MIWQVVGKEARSVSTRDAEYPGQAEPRVKWLHALASRATSHCSIALQSDERSGALERSHRFLDVDYSARRPATGRLPLRESGSEPDAPAMTGAQVIERRATNPPTRCVVVAPHRGRERRRAASLACDDRVVAPV